MPALTGDTLTLPSAPSLNPPPPAIIGHDVYGVIEEVVSHVTEFRVADAVYYTPLLTGSGTSSQAL